MVGGTLQPGRYDLGPEPEESRRIMREMEERLPPLKVRRFLRHGGKAKLDTMSMQRE